MAEEPMAYCKAFPKANT